MFKYYVSRRDFMVQTGLAAAATMLSTSEVLAAPAEVVVGAPDSLTGGYGEGGRQVVAGLQIAVDQINQEGGIKSLGGARIKLIPADTSSDNPAQASSVTRRLISQDKASILVGCQVSSMTLSAQIEAERSEVPLLSTSYADALVSKGYKYTFKVAPLSTALSDTAIDYVQELYRDLRNVNLSRASVFYGSDANSQAIGQSVVAGAKARGLDVVGSVSFQNGLADPSAIVSMVLSSKPAVIFLISTPDDTILITRALRNLGVKAPIVGGGTGVSVKSLAEALGPLADNLMGTLGWNYDLPIKGVAEFVARYHAAFPKEPYAPQEAGEGYAIGLLIRDALETAASADPKKLRDVFASIDVPSILPGNAIRFAANGQNSAIVPILVGWKNSELHTLWPKKYQTVKPDIQ
jgi:branched-chain amino acid transport system substrate-binding protein